MEPISNRKRRVLAIITQSELGGAQQFLVQLSRHIDPSRFEFAIATGSDGHNELDALIQSPTKKITLHSLKRKPSLISDIKSIAEIRQLIRAWRPDVLFLNSSKAGFNGSLATLFPAKLKPSPKVIYRIGGWTFNDPWPTYKKLAYFILEYISAGWKNIIVLNNQHDLDQAKRYHITPRSHLALVHNGISKNALHFLDKDSARHALAPHHETTGISNSNELWLGTIANFYPTKGLIYLIKAFAESKIKAKLCIIGDGRQRHQLESLIKSYGLTDKVILAGRFPDASQYLKAFDIFVLPSVKEGFPWAVLEAMSAGLPVVATKVGAIPEIIEHQHNGLIVPPGDTQALKEAISKLANEPELRERLGQKGQVTVSEKFTLEKMVQEFEKLFS